LLFIERSEKLKNLAKIIRPEFLHEVVSGVEAKWCDDIDTDHIETCQTLALDSLTNSIKELKRLMGSDIEKWRWGDVHSTFNVSITQVEDSLFSTLLSRKVKSGGSSHTVNMAGSMYSQDEGFLQVVGPTYRQVIDLASLESSQFVLSTGQAGNFFSKHYDDLTDVHFGLSMRPMFCENFDCTKSDAAGSQSILMLSPGNAHEQSIAK